MKRYQLFGDRIIVKVLGELPAIKANESPSQGVLMSIDGVRSLLRGRVVEVPAPVVEPEDEGEEISFVAADPMEKLANIMPDAIRAMAASRIMELPKVEVGDVVLFNAYASAPIPDYPDLYLVSIVAVVAKEVESE